MPVQERKLQIMYCSEILKSRVRRRSSGSRKMNNVKMSLMIYLHLLGWVSVLGTEICNTTVEDIETPSLFSINEVPIETVFKHVMINNTGARECDFNTTGIWSLFNSIDTLKVGIVEVNCATMLKVNMLPYFGQRHDNIIGKIQIGQNGESGAFCETTILDINHLAAGADIMELTLVNQFQGTNETNSQICCENLQNLSALTLADSQVTPEQFLDAFYHTERYMHMADIRLKNIIWKTIPDQFAHVFPNLQSLSLINNLTRVPSLFPWTNDRLRLPRNLTRTEYFDDEYAKSYYPQISPDLFKRDYYLDNNRIKRLGSYSFHGCLDMITMANNGMKEIMEDAFRNVSCLQSLRLDYNHIRNVTPGLFKGMTKLHELNLGHNYIDGLNDTLFDDLDELQILNLEHNFLTTLPRGLLSKLNRLQSLHLSSNSLKFLDKETFSINTMSLNKLYVDDNYLKSLPGFVYWMRGLSFASFTHNKISDHLSEYLNDTHRVYSSNGRVHAPTQVRLDLSHNKIEYFSVENLSNEITAKLEYLFSNFHVILSSNPISCDCNINTVLDFIQKQERSGKLQADDYKLSGWKCFSPSEMEHRSLFNVTSNETYCPANNMENCTTECDCFRKSNNETVLVDCRSKHLKGKIHDKMPEGLLELRYSDNCISEIPAYTYMERVVALDVSNNKITSFSDELLESMIKLETLNVKSNLLKTIPIAVSGLRKLKRIDLTDNPLNCDNCDLKSMKAWVMKNKQIVQSWENLYCIRQNGKEKETKMLNETTDADFACKKETEQSQYLERVMALLIVTLIIIIIAILLYVFRQDFRVLLYMYFGLHPFDRRAEAINEVIDCVVVHAQADTEWVMENIVKHLETSPRRYIVFDIDRDFIVGYSVHENLAHIIHHSKRIIICLSSAWNPKNIGFKLFWNSALKKIKETRSNYGIVICKDVAKDTATNQSLRKYIRSDRFIMSSERLFIAKIFYAMPRKRQITIQTPNLEDTYLDRHLNIYPTVFEKLTEDTYTAEQEGEYDIFVSHSIDNDYDDFVVHTLLPRLEKCGYKVCIEERDYLGGPTKEQNILNAINRSRRTLFILTKIHWNDDWSLFTYQKAYEKSLREKNNHLIVIIMDDNVEILDEEFKCYLSSYVTLNIKDTWFYNKLFRSLPSLQKHSSQETGSLDFHKDERTIDTNSATTHFKQECALLNYDELAEATVGNQNTFINVAYS